MYIDSNIHMHVYVYIYKYVYTYMHIYIYINIYIYIYMNIYTFKSCAEDQMPKDLILLMNLLILNMLELLLELFIST